MDATRDDTDVGSPAARLQETTEDVSDWHFVKLSGTSDCGSENASLASDNAEAHSNVGSACVSAVTTASEEHANAVLQEPVEKVDQAAEELSAPGQDVVEEDALELQDSASAQPEEFTAADVKREDNMYEIEGKGAARSNGLKDASSIQQLLAKAGSLETLASKMAVVTCQNLHCWKVASMEVLSSWYSVVNAWLDTISKHHLLPKPILQAVHQLRVQLKTAHVNWGIVSLSASLLVVSTAFLATAVHNKHLSRQLRQKDRELAKLVMKIFNLQDALQGLRQTPLIRHTSIGTFATHPVF